MHLRLRVGCAEVVGIASKRDRRIGRGQQRARHDRPGRTDHGLTDALAFQLRAIKVDPGKDIMRDHSAWCPEDPRVSRCHEAKRSRYFAVTEGRSLDIPERGVHAFALQSRKDGHSGEYAVERPAPDNPHFRAERQFGHLFGKSVGQHDNLGHI